MEKRQYIWHSGTGTLLAADECVIVRLTQAEADLIADGVEEPSTKAAEIIADPSRSNG